MLYEIDGKPAFRIDLYDHTVAKKWKDLIISIYKGDGEDIDHTRTFFHLQTNNEIKEILIQSIKNINLFLKNEFIKLPKDIDWDSQNFYKSLHESFEKLSGDYDNPTKLIKIAPMAIKESVRNLNYCVHALEHKAYNKKIESLPLQWTKKRIKTPRIKLEKNEYELIQFKQIKNEVYLAYNELGKSYIDLWKDNLPIEYNATKNNHYIGPDIELVFSNNNDIFEKKFLTWCEKNNVNPFKKSNGIGKLPIGKIKIIDLKKLTKNSKINIIIT